MAGKDSTKERRKAALKTPSSFGENAIKDLSGALNELLADIFALYIKTKNFHWHVSGPHFRDYHLLLDDQSAQIFAATDVIAERVRKIGGTTLRSIGQIAKMTRVADNDADFVTADRRVLLLDPAPLFSYAGAMAPSLPGMLSWAAIGLLAGLGSGG